MSKKEPTIGLDVLMEYFKKSYLAVDGLWFVKLEEELGFDYALELDRRVWEILPKIQARRVRELLKIDDNGFNPFIEAVKVKLVGEGYNHKIDKKKMTVTIVGCPWHEIMKKTNREHLSEAVGRVICATELGVWAREFGLKSSLDERICSASTSCVLKIEVV